MKKHKQTIHDTFFQNAMVHPNKTALNCYRETISYMELEYESNKVARALLEINFNKDIPVAIDIFPSHIPTIVSALGILKAGGFYVYLSSTFSDQQLSLILNDTQPEVVVSSTDSQQLKKKSIAARHVLLLDVIEQSYSNDYIDLKVSPYALSSLRYTSGSTGIPKGAQITHLCYQAQQFWQGNSESDDRVAELVNHTLDTFLSLLLQGTTVYPYYQPSANPLDILRWFKEQEITVLMAPVILFRKLMEIIPENNYLSSVMQIVLYGEAVLSSDVGQFRRCFSNGCKLINDYSMTEAYGIASFVVNEDYENTEDVVPVGYPCKDTNVYIMDRFGRPVRSGKVGNILVEKDGLSSGYWHKPNLTHERFIDSTVSRGAKALVTGDLGFIDNSGCIRITGRKDHQVLIKGLLVELDSIEAVLGTFDAVKEAAVLVKTDDDRDKKLVAYVAAKDNVSLCVGDIRSYLLSKLPLHMVPSYFVFMQSLPKLPSHKIDRKALPMLNNDRPQLGFKPTEPTNQLEITIRECWQRVLNIKPIGIHDNFFDLGGDSLAHMILIAEIERAIQQNLSTRAMLDSKSVAQMCREIQAYQLKGETADRKNNLDSSIYNPMLSILTTSQLEPVENGSLLTSIHSHGDNVNLFWCFNRPNHEPLALSKGLSQLQPLYCLYSGSGVVDLECDSNIKNIASYYLQEIYNVQPTGPYYLGGNCDGARVMYEICLSLIIDGHEVKKLCLLEFFDKRLFNYVDELLLIYGEFSHLAFQQEFGYQTPGWKNQFNSVPLVHLIPCAHGEFFNNKNIGVLSSFVSQFLGKTYNLVESY